MSLYLCIFVSLCLCVFVSLCLSCVIAATSAELTLGSSLRARAPEAIVVDFPAGIRQQKAASPLAARRLRGKTHITVGIAALLHRLTEAARQSDRPPGTGAGHLGRCAGTTRDYAMLLVVSSRACSCIRRTTGDRGALATNLMPTKGPPHVRSPSFPNLASPLLNGPHGMSQAALWPAFRACPEPPP